MGKIDAKTAVCGLIGNPVGHSISPFIHNTLAERLGFNLAYMTFKVEKGEVATAVKGAYALNIKGMNVTVPHKQEVMEAVIEIDELAKNIGAVNTLVRIDGGYKGYNTDIIGLKKCFEERNIDISGKTVVLVDDVLALAQICPGGALDLLVSRRTGKLVAIVRVDVLGNAAVGIRRGFHGDSRQNERIRRHKDHKAYGHR